MSCPGAANGALAGANGGLLAQLSIIESTKTFLKLTATFSKDTIVCPNEQVKLSATASSSGTISYLWSTSEVISQISVYPTVSSTYKVTVIDDNGCEIEGLINVDADFFPATLSPAQDTSICLGKTVTINVNTAATGTINYNWNTGEKSSQITVSPTTNQTYTVTVDNGTTCKAVKTILVTIASITADITAATTICPKNETTLQASTTASGNINYLWNTGEATSQISTSPSLTQLYSVTVSDENGCSTVKTTTVIVDSNAINIAAQITAIPDTALTLGKSVLLTASPANTTFHYNWSGENTSSNDTFLTLNISPLKTTQYCVKVTDANNCFNTSCKTIEVITPTPQIAIPNAFTPNGDGKNDLFKVVTTGSTVVYEMKIYNRWGELVFEENSNAGWNGNYKEVTQNQETYTCKIVYGTSLDATKKLYAVKSFVLLR